MKNLKILLGLLLFGFVFTIMPFIANAEVVMTNYQEVIDEEIETYGSESDYQEYIDKLKSADLEGYEESDSKVNVYIFRGKTCGYCLKAITYFAEQASELKDKINLKTYEVWSNSDNSELMSKAASALGKEVGGVPFIVIGEKSFDGFSESMDSEIKSAIDEELQKDKKYDIMDHLGEVKSSKSKYNNKKIFAILGVICLGIVGTVFAIKYANKKQAIIEEQKKKALEEKKAMEKKIAEGKKANNTKKTNNTKKPAPKKTTTKKSNNKSTSKKTTKKRIIVK